MRLTGPNRPEGRLEVIGLHPYPMTEELIREAMDLKHPFPDMSADEAREAEAAAREELSVLYVIEILVDDPTGAFDLGDVQQPIPGMDRDSWQAPYDERTLDTEEGDGSGTTRIAFFLHFVDPEAGLETPFGHVAFPAATPLPARLAEVMKYQPVD